MYQYRRTVQYYETDKMGITHHANYIKWMEEARIGFLDSIGLPFQSVEAMGIVSPVVGLSIDYQSPSTFGDEILIGVMVAKYTGVRLEVCYTMENSRTGTKVAAAVSKHCFLRESRDLSLKKENAAMHRILENALDAGRPE